mgnify:FL=1|jgi:hypothetical protein
MKDEDGSVRREMEDKRGCRERMQRRVRKSEKVQRGRESERKRR